MTDNSEAAAALLLLSTAYFRHVPAPQIYQDSDDDELMESLSNFAAFRPQFASRQPFTNKRQLSPIQCDGKRQRRLPPELEGGHLTPKSSINRFLPAANFFRPITPVWPGRHQHFDENFEHNYAALSQKSAGVSPQGTASPVTSEASLMDEVCVNIPVVQPWSECAMADGLSGEVRAELDKMQRDSKFAKETYTRRQIEASPIEFDYHPNKSHRNYSDPFEAETRAKNNLASRRSRHKKKQLLQVKTFNLEFDRSENRQLYGQEHWMADTIAALEAKILSQGYDVDELMALRKRCGLK